MRFSLITATLALSLTVSASQVNRREVDQSVTKCVASIKSVSDFLPKFEKSIKDITSYTSVIDTHIKEDIVEKRIRRAIKECKKVTHASSESAIAFKNILEPLIENIKKVTDALVQKKDVLDEITLARPLLEDSLKTIFTDAKTLEDHLIEACPEEHREEFREHINSINTAIKKAFDAFSIDE